MSVLDRFHAPNRWFDTLPEPRRVLTILPPLMVLIVVAQLYPLTYATLCVVGLYRWHWLYRSS